MKPRAWESESGAHRAESPVYTSTLKETQRVLDAIYANDASRAQHAARYLVAEEGHGKSDLCDAHILNIAANQCEHLAIVRNAASGSSVPLPPPIDPKLLQAAYETRENFGSLITTTINTLRREQSEAPISFDFLRTFARWTTFATSWPIECSEDIAGAWALELIASGRFSEADAVLTAEGENPRRPLLQAARIALYLESQRWGDLIDTVQRTVGELNLADLQLYAISQACLGMALASLDNEEPAIAAFRIAEASENPAISAWAYLRHGLYSRTHGDDTEAGKLIATSMVTHLTAQAEAAQNDPTQKLRTTTRALVFTRTDPWDVSTEDNPEAVRARDIAQRRDTWRLQAEALLDRQVGMASVKSNLRSIANLMRVNKEMERRGISVAPANYNQIFTGPPGVGKTTIVKAFTLYLASAGVIEHPEPIITGPEDFVSENIAGTGPKTKAVVAKAEGHLLFIDEAYGFLSDPSGKTGADSAGIEAINTLVGLLEPMIGHAVFVLAGYPEDISRILRVNPGLERRFPGRIRFGTFNLKQFSAVVDIEAQKKGLVVDAEVLSYLSDEQGPARKALDRDVTQKKVIMDDLGNGGFARNLVERASLRRANRIADSDLTTLSQEQMQELTFEDVVPAFHAFVESSMHGTPVTD